MLADVTDYKEQSIADIEGLQQEILDQVSSQLEELTRQTKERVNESKAEIAGIKDLLISNIDETLEQARTFIEDQKKLTHSRLSQLVRTTT